MGKRRAPPRQIAIPGVKAATRSGNTADVAIALRLALMLDGVERR